MQSRFGELPVMTLFECNGELYVKKNGTQAQRAQGVNDGYMLLPGIYTTKGSTLVKVWGLLQKTEPPAQKPKRKKRKKKGSPDSQPTQPERAPAKKAPTKKAPAKQAETPERSPERSPKKRSESVQQDTKKRTKTAEKPRKTKQ